MSRDETVILALVLAALVSLLFWRFKDEVAPETPSVTNLTRNQPFMFSPPVANILPNAAASMLGESIKSDARYYDPATFGAWK